LAPEFSEGGSIFRKALDSGLSISKNLYSCYTKDLTLENPEVAMEEQQLVAQVDQPALHRALLGSFRGPYSLGVGRDGKSSTPVLLLSVPDDVTAVFPAQVTVAGEAVPVIVRRGFQAPVPLPGKKA
jgi:hypothetical protein